MYPVVIVTVNLDLAMLTQYRCVTDRWWQHIPC